jgi:hypothetical protein
VIAAETRMLLDLPADAGPGAVVEAIVDLQVRPGATDETSTMIGRDVLGAEVQTLIWCCESLGIDRVPWGLDGDEQDVEDVNARVGQIMVNTNPTTAIERDDVGRLWMDRFRLRGGMVRTLKERGESRRLHDEITHGWVVRHSACVSLLKTLASIRPDAVVTCSVYRWTVPELTTYLDYDPRNATARIRPGPGMCELEEAIRAALLAALKSVSAT